MNTLTNEVVDQLYKDISNFEKDNIGIKYGSDFNFFAMVLAGSDAFKHWVLRSTMDGIMVPLYLEKIKKDNPEVTTDHEVFKDLILKESPYRQILLKAMYLGYRLGRESKE